MRFGIAAPLLLSIILLTGSIDTDADIQLEEVTVTVDSTNFRFSPPSVTVSEGDTVRFLWNGELLPHNAVEGGGIFDSGEPSRNVDYSFTFGLGTNGTYEYVCEPHEDMGMVGTIIVEAVNATGNETTEEETDETIEENTLSAPFLTILTSTAMATILTRNSQFGRGLSDE